MPWRHQSVRRRSCWQGEMQSSARSWTGALVEGRRCPSDFSLARAAVRLGRLTLAPHRGRRWWRGARVRTMRALVTGGGRGIGAGIARALAGDGSDVVVGARSRAQVEAVAGEIGGEWVEIDVADRGSVERSVAEAGELDLLVANAGVSEGHERRPSWEIDPAD